MTETSTGALAKALSAAQGEMEGAKRDAENPFYKSKYADLASVWDAIRGPLTDNGLAVAQTTDLTEDGTLVVVTTLMHESGESISGRMPVKAKDDSPQAMGSGVSYARRYALAAICGVAPEDDDGEAAQGRDKPAASYDRFKKAPQKPQEAPRATPADPASLSTADAILFAAESLSKLRDGFPASALIADASRFDGKEGPVSFENPKRVKSERWLKGTLATLEKWLHEETLKAEPGVEEAVEDIFGEH